MTCKAQDATLCRERVPAVIVAFGLDKRQQLIRFHRGHLEQFGNDTAEVGKYPTRDGGALGFGARRKCAGKVRQRHAAMACINAVRESADRGAPGAGARHGYGVNEGGQGTHRKIFEAVLHSGLSGRLKAAPTTFESHS
jgi:hypothetical protein